MTEQLKIATWNLCLGVSNKRDYIRQILNEHEIDILNMQETDLKPNTNPLHLSIKDIPSNLKPIVTKLEQELMFPTE
jgi:hypothetical protein